MTRWCTRCSVTALALAVAAPPVVAGPDWKEAGDAGSTPATAQVPVGTGTLKSIRGSTSTVLAGADLEDMYLVFIPDPGAFCAKTVALEAGVDCCGGKFAPNQGTTFNTQLWLFKADGLGLLGNDDDPGDAPRSLLLPLSDDGSGAALTTPGYYYLAVSGGPGRDPVSAGGAIFFQASLTEISGPDGAGGGSPITGWTGVGRAGDYEIVLCGVEFASKDVPVLTPLATALLLALLAGAGCVLIVVRSRRLALACQRA